MPETCYRCGAPATSREHFPPRSFFPRAEGLQLRTVPSCAVHNNAKSTDDQYLLAHVTLHAAREDNLAKRIFMRSIAPQLSRQPGFQRVVAHNSVRLEDGAVGYRADISRFDSFFDHLCYAVYFDRYGQPFNDRTHRIRHEYLSLQSAPGVEDASNDQTRAMVEWFMASFPHLVEDIERAHVGEVVYRHRIVDPLKQHASITIAHSFYGVFDVISLLTYTGLASDDV